MRRLFALVALCFALPALAGEVLVLTTVTRADPSPSVTRRAVEIQNLGPNAIYCQLRTPTGLIVGKGRRIATNEAWALDLRASVPVYCIAATANQVTTAATFVTEAF